jgi:predicted molibdopterin-dependent oxidoreductase YjgC
MMVIISINGQVLQVIGTNNIDHCSGVIPTHHLHFPEVPTNDLAIATLDSVSKIPVYKLCAVKIEVVK